MKTNYQKRISVLMALVVFVALVCIGRLYYIQIVHGDVFKEQANHQYVRRDGKLFSRGIIYFSDKSGQLVTAAAQKNGFTLAMNPKLIVDANKAYESINAITPTDKVVFLEKAAKTTDPYEEVQRHLPEEVGSKIQALKIPGVVVEKERWRFYPGKSLASQIIGFVGYDAQNNLSGRYGVERYYNDILSRDTTGVYGNFFTQMFSTLTESAKKESFVGEGDVVLTIEPSVQEHLESTLRKVQEKYSSEVTGGIVMNPKTGAIVAMGAIPNFDPNTFNTEKSASVFTNPLVEGVYEMGSIIKPITMASGLDAGVITPETTYDDKGFMEFDGKKISNYDHKGRGVVPMQEVLSQSLNTGVSFVMERLGIDRFNTYFRKFGIGEETGIDLPNEGAGLTSTLDSPRKIEHATASFGQGIAISPIATVRALSALGNGGIMVTPHVTKEIRYSGGIVRTPKFDDTRQAISKQTSETITRMLIKVVDTKLANGKLKMDHYSIAAKTGTAQIANAGDGKYYEDQYLHSFFGYFPAYDPQYIVFYFTVRPKGVQFASETLAMPFGDTAKFLINYYAIPPDR